MYIDAGPAGSRDCRGAGHRRGHVPGRNRPGAGRARRCAAHCAGLCAGPGPRRAAGRRFPRVPHHRSHRMAGRRSGPAAHGMCPLRPSGGLPGPPRRPAELPGSPGGPHRHAAHRTARPGRRCPCGRQHGDGSTRPSDAGRHSGIPGRPDHGRCPRRRRAGHRDARGEPDDRTWHPRPGRAHRRRYTRHRPAPIAIGFDAVGEHPAGRVQGQGLRCMHGTLIQPDAGVAQFAVPGDRRLHRRCQPGLLAAQPHRHLGQRAGLRRLAPHLDPRRTAGPVHRFQQPRLDRPDHRAPRLARVRTTSGSPGGTGWPTPAVARTSPAATGSTTSGCTSIGAATTRPGAASLSTSTTTTSTSPRR